MLVSPLGPATARETPHALRMIHILPTFQILGAYGLKNMLDTLNHKKFIIVVCAVAFFWQFFYYLNIYYQYWPNIFSGQWQYGYKEAVNTAKNYYNKVDNIYVTKSQGRPYIYFLLYMNFNPSTYHANSTIVKDQFFFLDVNNFDKFHFMGNDSAFPEQENSLYIVDPNALPVNAEKISTVRNIEGKAVFDIGIIN